MSRTETSFPTAPVAAASLVAGYAVARATGIRPLGGVVLALGGVAAGTQWIRRGATTTAVLATTYVAAFGLSHPLAKKIGAWPSVFTVAAVAGAAAWALSDRRTV